MIFESENYSPIERVDENLRRRVLDEMSRWDDSAPAMSGCVGGCRHSERNNDGQCRNVAIPVRESSGTVRPSMRCGCACSKSRTMDVSRDAEAECTAGCTDDSLSLAMVYSPDQHWRCLYCVSEGLDHGTIFRELNFPFYPTPCRKGGGCCDR